MSQLAVTGDHTSASSSTSSPADSAIIQHLKSFLHLTTQAPLEHVCTSALYLLNHVPSTRQAVLEYIGTFYKVATFLHLQFNRSQLKQKKSNLNAPDFVAEANNINHINQVIELIENSLVDILSNKSNNDIWSIELSRWFIELLGEIASNSGEAFANTPDMTIDEANSFRKPTIVDGLEIWSNQCKPTQSLLMLLQKCFVLVENVSTHLKIIDFMLETNFKYELKFDWVTCYYSALNPQLMFENFLKFSVQEFVKNSKKSQKVNVMNFYALNFSSLVKSEINKLIQQRAYDLNLNKKDIVAFLLCIGAQSPALTTLLVDEILNSKEKCALNEENDLLRYFVSYFVLENTDSSIINNLFSFLKQINNSVAIFDLISSLLEWFMSKNDCFELNENPTFIKTVQNLMVNCF